MQNFIAKTLQDVVLSCGIQNFMPKTLKDSITIVKPRVEYEFLTHQVKRTGRLLSIAKKGEKRNIKRELYTVELPVRLIFYGNTKEIRDTFSNAFFYYLPKGVNDIHGNYVRFMYQRHIYDDEGDNRIGESVIEVLKSYNAVYDLIVTYRITQEHEESFVTKVNPQII